MDTLDITILSIEEMVDFLSKEDVMMILKGEGIKSTTAWPKAMFAQNFMALAKAKPNEMIQLLRAAVLQKASESGYSKTVLSKLLFRKKNALPQTSNAPASVASAVATTSSTTSSFVSSKQQHATIHRHGGGPFDSIASIEKSSYAEIPPIVFPSLLQQKQQRQQYVSISHQQSSHDLENTPVAPSVLRQVMEMEAQYTAQLSESAKPVGSVRVLQSKVHFRMNELSSSDVASLFSGEFALKFRFCLIDSSGKLVFPK